VAGGVEEALALLRAAARRGEVDDVGGEPLARDLERRARARGRLVEEIDHRLSAKGRHLLDLAGGDLLHRLGGVEHVADLRRLDLLHPEQVFSRPGHLTSVRLAFGCFGSPAGASTGSWITTLSTPSCSRSITATVSLRLVGRFLPM